MFEGVVGPFVFKSAGLDGRNIPAGITVSRTRVKTRRIRISAKLADTLNSPPATKSYAVESLIS